MITRSCEEALVEAYARYRWHRLMDPLCDAFKRWKTGLADHTEAEQALDRAYQGRCALKSLLSLRLDHTIAVIQVSDRDWFLRWIEENCPPQGTELPTV